MRRKRPPAPPVPEELARFVESEWPGAGCVHEALRQWKQACAAWLAADSAREPRPGADEGFNVWFLAGESRRRLPFGEYGDAIDLLREGQRYRRAMGLCPAEYRPAQFRGPGR